MKSYKEVIEEEKNSAMVKDLVKMIIKVKNKIPAAQLKQAVASARKQIEQERPHLVDVFDQAIKKAIK